jgi:hypothetical protein
LTIKQIGFAQQGVWIIIAGLGLRDGERSEHSLQLHDQAEYKAPRKGCFAFRAGCENLFSIGFLALILHFPGFLQDHY